MLAAYTAAVLQGIQPGSFVGGCIKFGKKAIGFYDVQTAAVHVLPYSRVSSVTFTLNETAVQLMLSNGTQVTVNGIIPASGAEATAMLNKLNLHVQ
jgi:hypothetical protein